MTAWDYFVVTVQMGSDYYFKETNNVKIVINMIVLIFNGFCLLTGGIGRFMESLLLTIIICVPAFLIMGIYITIKRYPVRKQRETYDKMFEDISLYINKGEYPYFLGQEDTEYVSVLVFQTKIPIETWEAKKSLLESYLNKKIVKIKYFQENRNNVAIFVENKQLPTSIMWKDEFMREKDYYVLGIDHFGYATIDLNSTPHSFIAGESGSGKSNIMKSLIYQSIVKGYKIKLIDFKRGVSFALFKNALEIYSTYDKIQMLLESLVQETNDRLDLFLEHGVEDIKDYNKLDGLYMERIIVFIDELAELMRSSDKDINKAITATLETLARLSRAVGIHLIMGLQRVDSTIVTGQIKNNVSMRVCGHFVDPEPSRIMLGNDIATKIPDIKGRFILRGNQFREFQAFYITPESIPHIRDVYSYRANDKEQSETKLEETYTTLSNDYKAQDEKSVIDFNFDDII